ncbi:MAG: SpoIID/LytB domain-containing protein [Elusimicrobiota bacterium]
MNLDKEPRLKVGIIESAQRVTFRVDGEFRIVHSKGEEKIDPEIGRVHEVSLMEGKIFLGRPGPGRIVHSEEIRIVPSTPETMMVLFEVPIGRKFHWERKQEQSFYGELIFLVTKDGIMVINELPLEKYVTSVISSEMSARAPMEYLKAHAVMSRSWVLAQIVQAREKVPNTTYEKVTDDTIIRWYGREGHDLYDICNDDHCQRFHGFNKITPAAVDAISNTRGMLLMDGNEICDARFYKACGGWSENYEYSWQDEIKPKYLRGVWDSEDASQAVKLDTEDAVKKFIFSEPKVYCNFKSKAILNQILVDFDQETTNFFRWEVKYKTKQVSEIIHQKLGVDLGDLKEIRPLKRGVSGRLYLAEFVGTKKSIKVGKELEIRRALSKSHLYSGCFVVKKERGGFTFNGAGWGHGVGLCQIGAGAMAVEGKKYQEILLHYFRNAEIVKKYQ